MIRASGGAISMTQRLVVSATFGAIQTLAPILSAALGAGIATMDAKAIAASLFGLAQVASAISALVAYELQQKDLSLQLRGLNFSLSNITMLMNATSI